MKKIIPYLMALVLTFTGCTDEYRYEDEGVILGPDLRECLCCGGFFIRIQSDTLRFYTIPEGSGIQLVGQDVNFPINVNLDWSPSDEPCLGDEIIVNRIERR